MEEEAAAAAVASESEESAKQSDSEEELDEDEVGASKYFESFNTRPGSFPSFPLLSLFSFFVINQYCMPS